MSKVQHHTINNIIQLDAIYLPISGELALVEDEFRNLVSGLFPDSGSESLADSLREPAGRLYSALLILSAKSIKSCSPGEDHSLIRLAAILELIHAAIGVHDKLTDCSPAGNDVEAVNMDLKNKMALLGGDVLYSRAFLAVLNDFTDEIFLQITNLTRFVFISEIEQIMSKELLSAAEAFYRRAAAAATFMGLCCRLGAVLAGAGNEVSYKFESYGFNLGMACRIAEWHAAGYMTELNPSGISEAEMFALNAGDLIGDISDSAYKNSLNRLLEYVLISSCPKHAVKE